MFTTRDTTQRKQNLSLWPTQYKHFPLNHMGKNANKCCYRQGTVLWNWQRVMLSNGKEKTKTEEERHSAPDQQPLTQLWVGGIYMGLVGTVSLNAPCVQEEAITSGKRREKNPIRRVQDLMGWHQAWGREHARTHAHPRPTKETQRKVRAPPWFVGL